MEREEREPASVGKYTRQEFIDLYNRLGAIIQNMNVNHPNYSHYRLLLGALGVSIDTIVEDDDGNETEIDITQEPSSQSLYRRVIRDISAQKDPRTGSGYFHVMPAPTVRYL